MQFLDFSPPTIPTLDQQQDALQKGLGRALQWAVDYSPRRHCWRRAFTINDSTCNVRPIEANGFGKIITTSAYSQHIRDSVFNSLRTVNDERDAYQLCELAFHLLSQK